MHFISKTSDGDMENSETQVWLDFARACQHLKKEECEELISKSQEIGKMLNHMISYPEKYGVAKK